MVTVFLYASTAVATGVQLWYLLMWSIWGAPTSPLEYLALLGAVVLLVAAVSSHWKRRPSSIAAGVGLILLWMWYGPALYMLFRNPPLSFAFARYWILPLVPVVLLIATTGYSATLFWKRSCGV